MTWAVEFNPLVRDEDLPSIVAADRARILKAVRAKLTVAPEAYGERLRGELRGLWKLRVGEYRVIYHIRRSRVTVLVLKIGFRRNSEVYRQMAWRVNLPGI